MGAQALFLPIRRRLKKEKREKRSLQKYLVPGAVHATTEQTIQIRNKYDTGNYYCIKNTADVWHLIPPANINTNTSTACDTSRIKVDISDTMVLLK